MRFKRLFLFWMISGSLLLAQTGRRDFVQHLKFLAADELRGRGNYQPELEVAGEYIAEQFRRYGLEPAGENGTYHQAFQLPSKDRPGADNRLSIGSRRADVRFSRGRDYELVSHSGSDRIKGGLVFAGYGISAPELGYDDYAGLDVQSRVVLAFRDEPRPGTANRFGGTDRTPYSTDEYKIANARDHGASAIILVGESFDETAFEGESLLRNLGIPALTLNDSKARWLFALDRRDARALRRWIDRTGRPLSFAFADAEVDLTVDVVESAPWVRNVIGYLPGLSDEILVVGAHYDHVGIADTHRLSEGAEETAGEIHNGADDNASGTAGLLSLAREYQSERLRRGILFIAFAGEELGLLGSKTFVRHPTMDTEQILGMLNLDMIGRSRGDLLIGGIGTAREFQGIFDNIQTKTSLDFRYSQTPQALSDHLSFATLGIPVLFFFSGLHQDYHRPSDDWEKIDLPRTFEVLDVASRFIRRLQSPKQQLTYVDLRAWPGLMAGGRDRPVVFGMMPDVNWASTGLRIDRVVEGTPAFEAGLLEGDVLIGFDGIRIDSHFDLSQTLAERSAGDEVSVILIRAGGIVQSSVTLTGHADWLREQLEQEK